jgi:transcriptional regulator with XRE-family HTH domain
MAHADKKQIPLAAQVGAAARVARLRVELTQGEVAERIGLATEVYGRLERGLMLPSIPTLLRLCRALGVDSNTLLGFSSRPPSWLVPSSAPPEPPAARRLLRTVRRLTPRQLEVLGWAARAMVASQRPRTSRDARPPVTRGVGHGHDDEPVSG